MKASLTLLILSLLTSCVSFQSNIDRAATPEFTRLLVVSKLPNMRPDYLNMFLNTFPTKYEVCITDAGPLAFGNPDTLIRKQVISCRSEAILTINPYRNYTTGSGEYIASANEVLLELTDATTQKSFWKAIAQAGGSRVPTADQIVRRLRQDGIITGQAPYGKPMTSRNSQ
jgi:hypothetical protein